MQLIEQRERRRDAFEAGLHGITLEDDTGQAPPSRGALRSFHDRMKRRLGIG